MRLGARCEYSAGLAAAILALTGCGGSNATSNGAISTNASQPQVSLPHNDAQNSGLQLTQIDTDISPFIARVSFHGYHLDVLSTVQYAVQPKAGSVSKAVNVSYSNSALAARGYLGSEDNLLTLPVFGLYPGYTNQVALQFNFQDGSALTVPVSITTGSYTDPTGIYQHPTVLKQRAAGSALGFDFFFIKSVLGSPIIVDTDGEVRWALSGVGDSMSSALQGDEFVIGDGLNPVVHRVRLDGTVTQSALASTSITEFHHNIDYGNVGLLADVNTQTNGDQNLESNVVEMSDQGSILNHWDLAAIISAYMASMGDDPSAFVRPGTDWFHNNAAAYDPSDNSVIISSRENFVIKLDYQTGAIIWILGDPTKYWYTFASLRAKALTLASGGLYPIGQHAVSVTSEGHLLLFNDGLGSQNQPAGAPAGETRTYSAVSAYSIDVTTMTAQNIWNFKNGETIFSSICSSAYKAPAESLLIDYATADNLTNARLVGLDSNHNVVFDFQYPTTQCNTSWNAVPVPLDSFIIN